MNVTRFRSRVSFCCCRSDNSLESYIVRESYSGRLLSLLTISIVLPLGDTLYSLCNKEVEFVGLQCFSVG